MCVTKKNMEDAVSNLTKHLSTVSEAISVGCFLLSLVVYVYDLFKGSLILYSAFNFFCFFFCFGSEC